MCILWSFHLILCGVLVKYLAENFPAGNKFDIEPEV